MRSTRARSSRMCFGVDGLREAPADELVQHGAQLVDLVGFLDGIRRTKTPRFFSSRTRPDSSSARKASRTGPRETPSRSAIAASLSLLPAGRSPARMLRSSSFCTSIGSDDDWTSAMRRAAPGAAAPPGAPAPRPPRALRPGAVRGRRRRCRRGRSSSASCVLDPDRCRLSTICKNARPDARGIGASAMRANRAACRRTP